MKKQQINICQNHLPDFFKALKEGNMNRIESLEHKLTPSEECVACAYIFKSKGSVRDALESFLSKEGFEVEKANVKTPQEEATYWVIKIIIFFAIAIFLGSLFSMVKHALFGTSFNLFKFGIIENVVILSLTIFFFVIVDDRFLE